MRIFLMGMALIPAITQAALAQSVFNPVPPTYSAPRTQMTPYLNLLRGDPAADYYIGVNRDRDLSALQARPPITFEGFLRPNQTVDDRSDLDVGDKRLPPTGHPAGFMIYNSYYRVPNQRSFIPYNPQVRPTPFQ